MGKIERIHETAAKNPELQKVEYSGLITKFMLAQEPKFQEDIVITLRLSQSTGIGTSSHTPTEISTDQKNITVYYQLMGEYDKKKNKMKSYTHPLEVIEQLTYMFDKLPGHIDQE